MNTIKNLMLATITGAILLGAGVSYSANRAATGAAISAKQAVDIALAAVPGRVYELELEKEDGIMVWEVELLSAKDNKEYEVLIDATSGEVINMELEDDDWAFFNFKDRD